MNTSYSWTSYRKVTEAECPSRDPPSPPPKEIGQTHQRTAHPSPNPSEKKKSGVCPPKRYREVEDEIEGTTFKHRIAEIHATSMKRLSKIEATRVFPAIV
jgi:hypothetical protein